MKQETIKYTPQERLELLKHAMGEVRFNNAVDELVPFGGGLNEYYDLYKIPYVSTEPYQSHPTINATYKK